MSLLARAADSVSAVPLAARIHEGLVWSNRHRRTLLDKMLNARHEGLVWSNRHRRTLLDKMLNARHEAAASQ